MATPTETCALAVVGASARQAKSAPAQTIHLNPRILMPRLLIVLEAEFGFVHCTTTGKRSSACSGKPVMCIGCRMRIPCTPNASDTLPLHKLRSAQVLVWPGFGSADDGRVGSEMGSCLSMSVEAVIRAAENYG